MRKTLMLLVTMAAVTSGCARSENPLRGHEFESQNDMTKIILIFDKDEMRLRGKVVNVYTASYELSGDNMIVGRMASTMMMPIGNAADVEREYFKFMSDSEPKQISLKDGILTITDHSGKSFEFEKVK
ncbi:MAG: META domain-containing protein [Alphaproteobacteria bacterium]|nr:META domain-containing protein [Alphaproteobacteria bacterium]